MTRRDLIGERFGRLVVEAQLPNVRTGHRYWRCRCDCGQHSDARGIDLRAGRITSCGCIRRQRGRANLRLAWDALHKHGYASARPPEYLAWKTMRKRSRDDDITICDRWAAFSAFLADMGPRPSAKHRLSRLDTNLGFERSNVVWAPPMDHQVR